MLEKIENIIGEKLDDLREKEKIQLKKLKDTFDGSSIYLDCGLGDNMENIVNITSKIEVLEEILNEILMI